MGRILAPIQLKLICRRLDAFGEYVQNQPESDTQSIEGTVEGDVIKFFTYSGTGKPGQIYLLLMN